MARRIPAIAAVAILCANSSWSSAARIGGETDTDAPSRRLSPAPHWDRNSTLPDGKVARSTTGAFDFWQESGALAFPSRTADAICADLNGDGFPELIRLGIDVGNPYGGTIGITLGSEYGMQGAEIFTQSLSSPRSVRALDVNGDGLIDIVAAHLRPVPNTPNQFVRTARLYLQTGSGSFDFLSPAPEVDLAPGGEIVLLCDVDRDQIADLVSVGTAHELYYQKGLGLSAGTPAVLLCVQDAGAGFKPEAMDRLFEAFYTTKAHGMGMGLAISRSIIEAHGGRLWAEPNKGPGATFSFTLPTPERPGERGPAAGNAP